MMNGYKLSSSRGHVETLICNLVCQSPSRVAAGLPYELITVTLSVLHNGVHPDRVLIA